MASKDVFLNKFIGELRLKYGEYKISQEKVVEIWNAIKHIPDELLPNCAQAVKAQHDYFPHINKVVESCLETYKAFGRNNPPAQNVKGCGKCSNGARLVDNWCFRCPCPLGAVNYPSHKLYTGQCPFVEKNTETKTHFVRETRDYFYLTCKETGKKSFVPKENPWRDHNPNFEKKEILSVQDKEAYDSF